MYIYLMQWLWLKGGMAFMILEEMEEYVNLSGSITYYWKILMILLFMLFALICDITFWIFYRFGNRFQ